MTYKNLTGLLIVQVATNKTPSSELTIPLFIQKNTIWPTVNFKNLWQTKREVKIDDAKLYEGTFLANSKILHNLQQYMQ